MPPRLISFLQDDEGVTAIEYGLIAALIAVVLLILITVVGTELIKVWTRIGTCLGTPAKC